MTYPIGTTQHLHAGIERMHAAREGVHIEASNNVRDHSISDDPELQEDEDD